MINTPKLRILVVDDERVSALHTRKLLEKKGHKIEVAHSGAEAVATLNSLYFDLVLMSLELPEMNGIETTRAIRSTDDSIATTPIIALTGSIDPKACEQCIEAGMNDFMEKPFSIPTFEDTLQHMHNQLVFNA